MSIDLDFMKSHLQHFEKDSQNAQSETQKKLINFFLMSCPDDVWNNNNVSKYDKHFAYYLYLSYI